MQFFLASMICLFFYFNFFRQYTPPYVPRLQIRARVVEALHLPPYGRLLVRVSTRKTPVQNMVMTVYGYGAQP